MNASSNRAFFIIFATSGLVERWPLNPREGNLFVLFLRAGPLKDY
jgi:hypothetical protein